jgi:hypothetical protein
MNELGRLADMKVAKKEELSIWRQGEVDAMEATKMGPDKRRLHARFRGHVFQSASRG